MRLWIAFILSVIFALPCLAQSGVNVENVLTPKPTNGQIAIGNGSALVLGTITPGTGIGVTNGAGSITIATPRYTSSDQTITSAGSLTLAHGLGTTPVLIYWALVCATAELGYSVNDVVLGGIGRTTGSPPLLEPNIGASGLSIVPDATNLNVRYTNASPCFWICHKTTGVPTPITNASWKVRFYAQP